MFDTSSLSPAQRMYLELYTEAIFELPVARPDGTQLAHEDVVAGLARDTMSQESTLG